MQIKLPSDQIKALHSALNYAGSREIGGQIFGEQLAPSYFLVSDFTFQKQMGSVARFFVNLRQAIKEAAFFLKKQNTNIDSLIILVSGIVIQALKYILAQLIFRLCVNW